MTFFVTKIDRLWLASMLVINLICVSFGAKVVYYYYTQYTHPKYKYIDINTHYLCTKYTIWHREKKMDKLLSFWIDETFTALLMIKQCGGTRRVIYKFLTCYIQLFVLTLDEYCCNSIMIRPCVNDITENDVQLQSLWFWCVFYSYTRINIHILLTIY